MCMRFGRVAPPVVSSLGLGADVVAGAKAATFGTQQHDACCRVGIGAGKRLGKRQLQLAADRVQFLRPVQRDDADLVVDLVKHDPIRHGYLPHFALRANRSIAISPSRKPPTVATPCSRRTPTSARSMTPGLVVSR